jgi:hypothetical protein
MSHEDKQYMRKTIRADQMRDNDKLNGSGAQEIEAPELPDEWPEAVEYPVMAGFSELEGFNHAKTLKKRKNLEAGFQAIFIAGQQRGLRKACFAIRVIVRNLAKIRQRLGDRAPRVVARTMGDDFIKGSRTFVPTESGAGFGMYRSIADLQAKNCLYHFINTYALSWHEAALTQDYLEAVVSQTPGRHGWLNLPVPGPEEPRWEVDRAETDEPQTYPEFLAAAIEACQRPLPPRPPQPPKNPRDQMAAFLKERCEKVTQSSAEAEAPDGPHLKSKAKRKAEGEIDAAVLMVALEGWSIARGFMPPSRRFVGQYMAGQGIPRRESNSHTYYLGIRWKMVPSADAG